MNRTTLVAGSGRSGTTWLGNVIAAATSSRLIFEPFLHDAARRFTLPHGRPNELDNRQIYIPETATTSPYDVSLKKLLRGRSHQPWFRGGQAEVRGGASNCHVVKAIRANLFLGYIAGRWPQLLIVFVYRDPVSVIDSQLRKMRNGWKFRWEPQFVLEQPRLMEDWLEPFRERICAAQRPVEKQALRWCIENYVPLKQLHRHNNVLIVSYSELCSDQQQWSVISSFLTRRGWRDAQIGDSVGQVSITSDRHPCDKPGRPQHKELTRRDIAVIRVIVEQFGLGWALRGEDLRSAESAA